MTIEVSDYHDIVPHSFDRHDNLPVVFVCKATVEESDPDARYTTTIASSDVFLLMITQLISVVVGSRPDAAGSCASVDIHSYA